MIRVFGFLWVLFLVSPLQAQEALRPVGEGLVKEIIDGDTVVLEDKRQVRFVGIQAPKLPLGRPGYPTWPLGPEAKTFLAKLSLGKKVTLRAGGQAEDRHGRTLAHLYLDDGTWLQGEMLKAGLARVYTFPDNRAMVPEMLALEEQARAAKRGIWALDTYRIRQADKLETGLDGFFLVEGTVLEAANVRGTIYLNFGADWKTDFTVMIGKKNLKAFTADPSTLQGKRIRVRGWIKDRNGPMIEATHPEQIEVLK